MVNQMKENMSKEMENTCCVRESPVVLKNKGTSDAISDDIPNIWTNSVKTMTKALPFSGSLEKLMKHLFGFNSYYN